MLLAIMTVYLLKDYELGYLLGRDNFQTPRSTFLFKASMLRVNALFLEQKYLQERQEHKFVTSKRNISQLQLAIKKAHQALDAFQLKSEVSLLDKSTHGMALAHFHLGFLM